MRGPSVRYFHTLLLPAVLTSCSVSDLRAPSEFQAHRHPSTGTGAVVVQNEAAGDANLPQAESMWSQQRLVRSAELRMKVDSVPFAIDRVDSIAVAHGGLLADVMTSQDDGGRRTARLVVRVPNERFAGTQSSLRQVGEAMSESIKTEDVTKAYADLETRVAVKEEAVARLRRLLAEQTGALSDVLDVERELARAVAELEGLKGERRFYDQRIAVSTIGVTLLEPGARLQASASLADALRTSLALLLISSSWLLYALTFLMPWIVVAALVWVLVRGTPRPMRRS